MRFTSIFATVLITLAGSMPFAAAKNWVVFINSQDREDGICVDRDSVQKFADGVRREFDGKDYVKGCDYPRRTFDIISPLGYIVDCSQDLSGAIKYGTTIGIGNPSFGLAKKNGPTWKAIRWVCSLP